MYRITFFCALALGLQFMCFGQTGNVGAGAKSMALGSASVAIADEWAYFNNVGSLAFISQASFGAGIESRFNCSSIQQKTVFFNVPFQKLVIAGGINSIGNSLYHETLAGLALGMRLDQVSVGIKGEYLQIVAAEAPTRKSFLVEIGGLVPLTQNLTLGCHIWNTTRAAVKVEGNRTPLPVIMRLGVAYKFYSKLLGMAEVYKNIFHKTTLNTGLQYEVVKILALRLGVTSYPVKITTGFGIVCKKRVMFDYGFASHMVLGNSHQISLTYVFLKKQ